MFIAQYLGTSISRGPTKLESSIEATPACGRVEADKVPVLPAPHGLEVGRVSSETSEAPDSRCVVWRQYPCSNATVGVLIVPLKGYG